MYVRIVLFEVSLPPSLADRELPAPSLQEHMYSVCVVVNKNFRFAPDIKTACREEVVVFERQQ